MMDNQKERIIGWQFRNADSINGGNLTDKCLFRSEQDAIDYARDAFACINNFVFYPVYHQGYREDMTQYTFLGKKERVFHKGEVVYSAACGAWMQVAEDCQTLYDYNLVKVISEDGESTESFPAHKIYRKADNKKCPRCGRPVCVEHNECFDFPYYCPTCTKNQSFAIDIRKNKNSWKAEYLNYYYFNNLAEESMSRYIKQALDLHQVIETRVKYMTWQEAEDDGADFMDQFVTSVTIYGRKGDFEMYVTKVSRNAETGGIRVEGYVEDSCPEWTAYDLYIDNDTSPSIGYFIHEVLEGDEDD